MRSQTVSEVRHRWQTTCSSRRGSILVLTLVLVAVLAISVAAMLANVHYFARSSREKIAYETAYSYAMAGLQQGVGWMSNPAMAKAQLGETNGKLFEGVTSGGVQLSSEVLAHVTTATADSSWRDSKLPGTAANDAWTTAASLASGSFVNDSRKVGNGADGRAVLWEYTGTGTNPKVLAFQTGYDEHGIPVATQTGSLLNSTENLSGYVSRIRFTTPFSASGSGPGGRYVKDDLLRTSIIVEAEGVALLGNREVKRTVAQKLLVVPVVPNTPATPPTGPVYPAASGNAIVGGHALTFSGSSHQNVHWGTVQCKGDIKLLDISYTKASRTLTAVNKYFGAGIPGEEWLRWQCSGTLYDDKGSPLFTGGAGTNSIPVTDFFTQLKRGDFTGWDGSSDPAKGVVLNGTYTVNNVNSAQNTLFYAPDTANGQTWTTMLGTGALVQGMPAIASQVDSTIAAMDYNTLKQFAIKNGGYMKPVLGRNGLTGFVNAQGAQLYYNTTTKQITTLGGPGTALLTDPGQLNMKSLLSVCPSSGGAYNTHAVDANGNYKLPDRVMFIDVPADNSVQTYSPGSGFFWRGIMYVCGNWDSAGAGSSPTILGKNPTQFYADPNGSTGTAISNCMLDGILFVKGTVGRTGNGAMYGTMIVTEVSDGAGCPDIYYNSLNAIGRMGANGTPGSPGSIGNPSLRLISGEMWEMDGWVNTAG